MKNAMQGFFMVEFLVYFFLFSCISYCLMHFVVSSSLRLREESKKLVAITELLTALDCIGHTIQNMPVDLRLWKEKNNESLIWHDAEHNVDNGICKIKNKVWYIVGTYSIFKKNWVSKRKELIATHIQDLSFTYVQKTFGTKDLVDYVTCSITSNAGVIPPAAYTVEKTIVLENRVLL